MLSFIFHEEQEEMTLQVYKTIRVKFCKTTFGSASLTDAVSKSGILKSEIHFWNNTTGEMKRQQSRHLKSQ